MRPSALKYPRPKCMDCGSLVNFYVRLTYNAMPTYKCMRCGSFNAKKIDRLKLSTNIKLI